MLKAAAWQSQPSPMVTVHFYLYQANHLGAIQLLNSSDLGIMPQI